MFQLPCSSWLVRVDKWGRRPDPALSPQSGQVWPLPPRAECWEPLGLGGQAVPRTCEAGPPVHISTSPGTSSQFLTKPRFPFCAVPSWGDIWRGHYQEFRGVTNPKSGQLERPGGVMDIRGAGRPCESHIVKERRREGPVDPERKECEVSKGWGSRLALDSEEAEKGTPGGRRPTTG